MHPPRAPGTPHKGASPATVSAEACSDAGVLQAYQEQYTTVEPGFRWIKNPAAIAPVWLEKPERIAALALLTVLGLLGYSNLNSG